MSVVLDSTDHEWLMDLLQRNPLMQDEESRRALLRVAGLDRLVGTTDVSGAPLVASANIVASLVDYGRISHEREALGNFLSSVKSTVGLEQQGFLDQLLHKYHLLERAAPPDEQQLRPMPKRILYKGKEYIYIPAGPFLMGSLPSRPVQQSETESADETQNEVPQHQVDLEGYYIARTPVTNAEYRSFVVATAYPVPHAEDEWSRPFNWDAQGQVYPAGQEDYPVVLVSWHAARAYAAWLGSRLPTEAEWEKAARGNDRRVWPWGNIWQEGRCNTAESGLTGPTPVGHFSPRGDSPLGVSDMAGNVWEWCSSLRDPYPYRVDDSRERADAVGKRVLRGGAWGLGRDLARCAFRGGTHPEDAGFSIGFRVVLSDVPAGGVEVNTHGG